MKLENGKGWISDQDGIIVGSFTGQISGGTHDKHTIIATATLIGISILCSCGSRWVNGSGDSSLSDLLDIGTIQGLNNDKQAASRANGRKGGRPRKEAA